MSEKPFNNVLQISDYREPPQKTQYELYPLPFFAAEKHSTWAVEPTGDYAKECDAGRAYALEFLKSCDGTVLWTSLLGQIAADMIEKDDAARIKHLPALGFFGQSAPGFRDFK